MIHEVMILDYSGVDLAFILYASATKLFVLGAFLIPILIPYRASNVWTDVLIFFCGMTALAFTIGVVESTMARLRLNRVMYLLISAFILAVFGLIVTLVRGHA